MAINTNAENLVKRVQAKIAKTDPKRQEIKQALLRIGLAVQNEAKLNIRKNGLVDTGRLMNSIKHRLFEDSKVAGVEIGSFAVPYAAIHEFGFTGNVNIRQHVRVITQAFGRPLEAPVSATIKAHSRYMVVRARPYLRPAFKAKRQKILDILREVLNA